MIIFLTSLLFAESEPSAEATDEPVETPEKTVSEETVLEAVIEEKDSEGVVPKEDPQETATQDISKQMVILINESSLIEDRKKAVDIIHKQANMLPSLYTLSLYGPKELRMKILSILVEHPEDENTYKIADETLKNKPDEDIYEEVFSLLSDLQNERSADILKYHLNSDVHTKDTQKRIKVVLQNRYSDLYQEKDSHQGSSDLKTTVAFSSGSAFVGGVVLASLGVPLGGEAMGLGATFGVPAGGYAGWLYARDREIGYGDALYFTNISLWGFGTGSLLAADLGSLDSDRGLVFSALSTLGAASYAINTINKGREVSDIYELNFLALQGGFLTSNLYGLIRPEDSSVTPWALGSTLGLISAEFISPTWKPDLNTMFLCLLYGIEGGVATSTLSSTVSNEEALYGLGFSSGVGLAVLQDSLYKIESHNVITSAFGAYTGHLLGLGLTGIFEDSFEPDTRLTSIGGVAGTVIGAYWATKRQKIDPAYLLSSGFLLGVQGLAIGTTVLLNDESADENIPEVLGFTSLLISGGNIGAILLQDQLQLTGDDAVFLTSTSLWGSYIGNVGAIALNLDVSPSEVPLTQLAFFDLGLLGGAILLMDDDFNPRSSINTQLYAALGGTLGAYTGFLLSDTTNTQGAALGSLLGVALGGVYGARQKKKLAFLPSLPFLEQSVFSAAPKFSKDGQLGVQLNFAGILGTPKKIAYSY